MAIKIYIDQGHNPESPNAGAERNGLREQDITYRVGQELATLLRQNGNFAVRLSRPTPETQIGTSNASSLSLRVRDANEWGADYFISIHTNASTSPTPSGSEQLVYRTAGFAYRLASLPDRDCTSCAARPCRPFCRRSDSSAIRETRP